MTIRENLGKMKKGFKYHVVDSAALLLSSNPIYSAFETFIAGMPDEVSIKARLLATGLTYGGMGFAWGKGRDLSRRIFNVTERSLERIQTSHDAAYSAAFTAAVSPLLYMASGARDLKEVGIGTASAVVFGLGIGPLLGYAVDVARDLTGLDECNRPSYPDAIKRQRPIVKKGLAGLIAATSIGAMAGIYALTPENKDAPAQEQRTIQVDNSLLQGNGD